MLPFQKMRGMIGGLQDATCWEDTIDAFMSEIPAMSSAVYQIAFAKIDQVIKTYKPDALCVVSLRYENSKDLTPFTCALWEHAPPGPHYHTHTHTHTHTTYTHTYIHGMHAMYCTIIFISQSIVTESLILKLYSVLFTQVHLNVFFGW